MARAIPRGLEHVVVTRPRYYVFTGVLGAVVLWGFYAWALNQLRLGLGVTGMNTPVYWGAYIVNFVLFIGLSAGGIIVAAVAYAAGVERFRPVARIAEIVAISCLIMAMLAILFDLGRPDRMWHLLRYARSMSPLIWDFGIVTLYLGLAMAMGYLGTRKDLILCLKHLPERQGLYKLLTLGYTDDSPKALERDHKVLKVLAIISIPGAVLLHSITAWLLGLLKGVPGWHTSIIAPLFIGSALVSGLALVIVATILARRFLRLAIQESVVQDLGRLLFFLIPLLGYFMFSEFLTVVYAGEVSPLVYFKNLMFGVYAPLFWFDLFAGLIIPWLILWRFRRSVPAIGTAAVLVLVGVLAERANIVIPPLLNRALLPYPQGFYMPTWVEFSIVFGLYALGALIFSVLAKLFPLTEAEAVPEHGHA